MNLLSLLTGCAEVPKRNDDYPFRRTDFALPHLAVCAFLAAGEALGFAAAPASSWWPVAAISLLVVALVGFGWSVPRWPYVAVLLLGFALALRSESRRARVFDRCDYSSAPLSADFPVDGRVIDVGRYLGFDSSVDGVDVRVMIRRPDPGDGSSASGGAAVVPKPGETWRCTGWLERRDRRDRRRRSLWVCGAACSAVRTEASPPSAVGSRLRRLRLALSRNLGYGLDHDPVAADLERAIVLGERTRLPSGIRRVFGDAGTVHVFAVSGLHVGVIAGMLVYALMIVCCFPLRWVAIPLAPILCGYVVMIGAPPSAVRAAVMSVIYYSAPLFLRRSDSLVAWALTFASFHVVRPDLLTDVGSQLSFTVMLGILLYGRWAESFGSVRGLALGVSAAAWFAGVPITASVFERVTVGGLFVNMLMIPLASAAVVLGLLGALLGFASPWLAAHANNSAALLVEAMTGVSWVAARIPGANLVVEPWPWWKCVAWYAVVLLAFWLIRSVRLRRVRSLG